MRTIKSMRAIKTLVVAAMLLGVLVTEGKAQSPSGKGKPIERTSPSGKKYICTCPEDTLVGVVNLGRNFWPWSDLCFCAKKGQTEDQRLADQKNLNFALSQAIVDTTRDALRMNPGSLGVVAGWEISEGRKLAVDPNASGIGTPTSRWELTKETIKDTVLVATFTAGGIKIREVRADALKDLGRARVIEVHRAEPSQLIRGKEKHNEIQLLFPEGLIPEKGVKTTSIPDFRNYVPPEWKSGIRLDGFDPVKKVQVEIKPVTQTKEGILQLKRNQSVLESEGVIPWHSGLKNKLVLYDPDTGRIWVVNVP